MKWNNIDVLFFSHTQKNQSIKMLVKNKMGSVISYLDRVSFQKTPNPVLPSKRRQFSPKHPQLKRSHSLGALPAGTDGMPTSTLGEATSDPKPRPPLQALREKETCTAFYNPQLSPGCCQASSPAYDRNLAALELETRPPAQKSCPACSPRPPRSRRRWPRPPA